MRKKIVVGNWKMNKTVSQTVEFLNGVSEHLHDEVTFGVGAPFTALAEGVKHAKGLFVAAQNVHFEPSGAFTGEVSIEMLQELGVKWVIVGHSERRTYFNETDETVNKKVKALLNANMTPIVCVGETLTEFEAGQTETVVRTSVSESLKDLTSEQVASLVIAYEPVWAIGTGRNATQEIAQNTCAIVRDEVKVRFGQAAANAVRIQYGGSVKPDNIKAYLSEPDIDGALIGGASLKVDSFLDIVNAVKA
ncbi:MAG: triose-phosphate isomerase [Erysipelotrichaceae bacterium]|nr:triose-phosphate isomerase [Erysipelotrichaceae bacterium]